ncbi:hypothetical protein Syun_004634 [Stephania yunnanensis]|uniref:Syntaxin 6/10/61 N-terminal domain-containing protein n=1 Tax=Stephania yunnanensis TaxID=152371 RepID=A0AAP0Q112_9MAGN
MASNIDRWEKDPFFPAAEEVQDSADRMESAYRIWVQETKHASGVCNQDELFRDVHTALGTAKWQLEEFERAVRSSYNDNSADDAKTRHNQFIAALDGQVSMIENSLNEASSVDGKSNFSWVRLDEGERDELALFLLGSSPDAGKAIHANVSSKDENLGNLKRVCGDIKSQSKRSLEDGLHDCSSNSCRSIDIDLKESKEVRPYGHRRTASASADIGALRKCETSDESFWRLSTDKRKPDQAPPRVPSFSGMLSTAESMPKNQWLKNGSRKCWKLQDVSESVDRIPLQSHQMGRGVNAFYERNKSSLDICDNSYDKRLYGWPGAVQRQLQRSQYHLQYSRLVQVFFSILILSLIVLFGLHII